MRMFQDFRCWRFDRQSAGHPQMNVKTVAIVQRNNNTLAAAVDVADRSAGKLRREIKSARTKDVAATQIDALDTSAENSGPQREHNGLNFRQFGHDLIILNES